GFAPRTYGVTNGAADRTSPDSSGSPQRRDAAAASWCYSTEIQRIPVDFAPEREDYKRIAGSSHYKYCWATAPYYFYFYFFRSWVLGNWNGEPLEVWLFANGSVNGFLVGFYENFGQKKRLTLEPNPKQSVFTIY
ncbi:MAG: hypothetical protein RIS47_242, partial [Bacteroidota bacterium]